MVANPTRCQAITKAGAPCKNPAQPGSVYCAVHLRSAVHPLSPPSPSPEQAVVPPLKPAAPDGPGQVSMELLLHELDALAQELQRRARAVTPAQLLAMLNRGIGRYAPEVPREVLKDLEHNLEGTTFQDLVDPETLKGLWYVLTYTLQGSMHESSQAVRTRLRQTVAQMPGGEVLVELAGNLEGTSPRDLVDPQTWKGFFYIVSYTAQQQVAQTAKRLMGKGES